MPSTIWNKYKKIKEIDNKSNIKTYLAKIEPIIKEIRYKNKKEYHLIRDRIEGIKNKIKIYDIIEEEDKIYIVIENNKDTIQEIDKLILDEIEVKKEGILKGQGSPVKKSEIIELLKMEKSMCKINYEKIEDNEIKKGNATGFFCKIDNFPIKYGLFTNNHVLDENDIKKGNIINIEYNNKKKKIKIDEKRRTFTDEELDYTCIELYKSDNIKDYFEIDPILFKNKKSINNSDIFILQYPEGNELSFSYGKIISLEDNNIKHNASTKEGSSGSPIIRRSEQNYIIGLHYGEFKNHKNKNDSSNLATIFDSILNHINPPNEINCIYKIKDNENIIQLLHDYNLNVSDWDENNQKKYLEAKETNKKFYEENIEIYINDEPIKFDWNVQWLFIIIIFTRYIQIEY